MPDVRPPSRLLATATAALVLAAAAPHALQESPAPPVAVAAAPTSPTTSSPVPASTAPVGRPHDETLLDEPALGPDALEALESRRGALRAAARVNGRTPAQLRAALADETYGLDRAGRLFVADELGGARHDVGSAGTREPAALVAPLDETFSLHSRPGARRTIHLDVDGHRLAGTWWNSEQGVPAATYEGWDPAGDGPAFSPAERRLVQEVWARVAEDYAPYDVDVTTADPGDAALLRTSAGDGVFGMRAVVSDSAVLADKVAGAGSSTIGMAYLGIFDQVLSGSAPAQSPALVFSGRTGSDAATVADTVGHEVGHTLDLDHVAGPRSSLHHPLMYASVGNAPVSVWTSTDQSRIPSGGLVLRPDEVGTSAATAPRATEGAVTGTITSPADADWFRFDGCTDLVATATPAPHGPNLDLRLSLRDPSGTEIASDAPATRWVDGRLTGMGAALTRTLAGGTHYLVVTGAGSGADGVAGSYDATGSLGDYTLDVTGCDVDATAPGKPTEVSAVTKSTGSTTVSWSPPTRSGGSPVTGYVVTVGDRAPVTLLAHVRSHTVTTGAGTRVTVSVAAVNAVGTSTPATGASLLPPPAPLHVSLRSYDSVRWLPVVVQHTDDPGTELVITFGSASYPRMSLASLPVLSRSTHPVGSTITAKVVNAAGESPARTVVVRDFPVAPTAPTTVAATATEGGAHLAWAPPADDGGALATYEVRVDSGAWTAVGAFTRSYAWSTLAAGPHTLAVRATHSGGRSTTVSREVTVVGTGTEPTPEPEPEPGPEPEVAPGAPTRVRLAAGAKGGPRTVVARWQAPKATGSQPVTRYRVALRKVNARGVTVGRVRTVTVTASTLRRQVRLPQGRWTVRVRASSDAGWSAWSPWTRAVRAR